VRTNHTKLRYEGLGLAPGLAGLGSGSTAGRGDGLLMGESVALYVYLCGANASDVTLAPAGWTPARGGPCKRPPAAEDALSAQHPALPAQQPALVAFTRRTGPSAADLVALEVRVTRRPA
jgi:hypothetical protein